MAVCAALHSPARVKTAPTKSAYVKTTPAKSSAYERPSAAEMAAAATAASTTTRERGGTSQRNDLGKSCKGRGDFPEG
jgi:hypothetical protein